MLDITKRRVFYFSPNIFENYRKNNLEFFSASPGGNKMIGVVSALSLFNSVVWTVSAPVVSHSLFGFYKARALRGGKRWASIYFVAFKNRILNRFAACFSYFWFCFKNVSVNDRVILYNYFPEYIPAAIFLRLVGNPAILDIEDSPRKGKVISFFELLNRCSYIILKKITRGNIIAASSNIAEIHGGNKNIVCYGANRFIRNPAPNFDTLTVLFSGAKTDEWGNGLFSDAIHEIALWPELLRRRVIFNITGFGDFDHIYSYRQKFAEILDIRIFQNCPTDVYENLLRSSNVSLELRIPNSEGANTTFPSKVIESIGSGLLLVTTGTGDITKILSNNSAVFLPSATGVCLSDALINIIKAPALHDKIASNGYVDICDLCSPERIGGEMTSFLFPGDYSDGI